MTISRKALLAFFITAIACLALTATATATPPKPPAGEPIVRMLEEPEAGSATRARKASAQVYGYSRIGSYNVGGASISVQYWNGWAWVTAVKGYSQSNGYYGFLATPGYTFRILASKILNYCSSSRVIEGYQGTSANLAPRGGYRYQLNTQMVRTVRQACW